MTPFASMLLAGAAASQPVYPVDAVLSEMKEVCFTDRRYSEDQGEFKPLSEAIGYWLDTASNHGWQQLTAENASTSRELKVLRSIQSLNSAISGSYIRPWTDHDDPAILGGQVFKKSVAGRMIFLSVFGVDVDGYTVGECRIHDLLGDRLTRNPFTAHDIQKIVGMKPRRFAGPFSSDRYFWNPEPGKISQMDVHFGFKGWRLGPYDQKIQQFDPYAPYGLTLVASFLIQEIVI